ncbi:MAG: carboxylating nicotinate-nucleotide diphosphorylase [Pseudomonadota bacterium]
MRNKELGVLDFRRIEKLVELWLDEDIGHGDLTANLMVGANATGRFCLAAREPLVVAGLPVAQRVFQVCGRGITVTPEVDDGATVDAGATLAYVEGRARPILTAERTALNVLQHLCGIATETSRYVAAVEGTGAEIVDTRKTTPGLRMLEKYAVMCGGGRNHRLGLDGGIMLKDNHIAVAGSIRDAVEGARKSAPLLTKIEVECDTLDQVRDALTANADVIMLDNMDNETMREAVALIAGRAVVECSGGVRLETVRSKAETGVDVISVGRITQAAPAVDIGLDEA